MVVKVAVSLVAKMVVELEGECFKSSCVAVLQEMISSCICELFIIVYHYIDWFFTCLVLYAVSFHVNYCRQYVTGCFTRSYYFVSLWNIDHLVSSPFILFTDIRIIIKFVCFLLNYCSDYGIGCIYRRDIFVWLWNHYHLVSSSLISFSLALVCMLLFSFLNIVAGILLAVFKKSNLFVC